MKLPDSALLNLKAILIITAITIVEITSGWLMVYSAKPDENSSPVNIVKSTAAAAQETENLDTKALESQGITIANKADETAPAQTTSTVPETKEEAIVPYISNPTNTSASKSTKVSTPPPVLPSGSTEITDPSILSFGIVIPSLGIKAPIVANVNGFNESNAQAALQRGVAHFGGTPIPQGVYFGHSSTETNSGAYDRVFAKLGNLSNGAEIDLYYQNTKYVYKMSGSKVVSPTDTSIVQTGQFTLFTCWPIGTSTSRLVITANPG